MMNNYATPEDFKPGERWLAVSEGWQSLRGPFHEVECIEWSPSGKYVKVRFLTSGIVLWFPDVDVLYLLERLPDESKTNQAPEPARTVEDDSSIRVYAGSKLAYSLPRAFEKDILEAVKERLAETENGQAEIAYTICRCEKCERFRNAPAEEIAASNKPD